jgi:hypothetical protein
MSDPTFCPGCDASHYFDAALENYPTCEDVLGKVRGREVCLFVCACGATVGVRIADKAGETFYAPVYD